VRVFVLGSGSTGNCVVVEAEGARVVIDAGLNPTQATRSMRALGGDLFGGPTLGVVVSHHHGDHIAQLLPMARALRAPAYLHRGIVAHRARQRLEVREYTPGGAPVRVGPFEIEGLFVPHDAPQVAVRVAAGPRRFGIATDLGTVKDDLVQFLGACDLALVEANFCPRMLAEGPYPPRIQDRVRGPFGHLANEQTAELARKLQRRRLARLVLGHVSRSNNTPDRALAVVAARCPSLPVEVIPHGGARAFEVTARPMYVGLDQLALPFA
jgi:phosphoribosyl 1,2-cyclic phosphodiesterase